MGQGEKIGGLRKKITHEYVVLILQLVSHRSFQKHEFFLQLILSAPKRFVWKVSVMAQVIKKYIFLSGAKSNDSLHIDYFPNSSSLRSKHNEPKNHSNGMNEHKSVKEDQT